MKYFIVTLLYEEMEVVIEPIQKDFIVETPTFPSLTELLQSPKYAIDGYRRVGIIKTVEISKQTAESILKAEFTS